MEAVGSAVRGPLPVCVNLKDWGFRDQITRSGLSIPSNIAEGFERDGDPEIARFLTFSKGSAGELTTQIYIGIEAGYIEKQQGMGWVREAKELSRMLGALINKHRQRRTKTTINIFNCNPVHLSHKND